MTDEPTYDRTNLEEVYAEYKRQASLPMIILSGESMQSYVRDERTVKQFIAEVDATFESTPE